MIIEHVFVTTLDGPAALQVATQYLAAGGFGVRGPSPFPIGPMPDKLDVVRGKTNAARAKSLDELPQRVWLEWDRGRVTVAASIEYFQVGAFSAGSRAEPPPHSPKLRPYVELMQAMVGGLEAALAHRLPVEQARRPWAELEARLRDEWHRKRRRHYITIFSVLAVIILLIVLAITVAVRMDS